MRSDPADPAIRDDPSSTPVRPTLPPETLPKSPHGTDASSVVPWNYRRLFDVPWVETGSGGPAPTAGGRQLEALLLRALNEDTDSDDDDDARSADDAELDELEEEGGGWMPAAEPERPKRHRSEQLPASPPAPDSGSDEDAAAEALDEEEQLSNNKYAFLLQVALRDKAAAERRQRAQQREIETLSQQHHDLEMQVALAKREATKARERVRRVMDCVTDFVTAQQAAVLCHTTTPTCGPPVPAEPPTQVAKAAKKAPEQSSATRRRGRPRKEEKITNPKGVNQHAPSLPSLGFTLRELPPKPGTRMEQWELEFLKRGKVHNGWCPLQVATALKRNVDTVKAHWGDAIKKPAEVDDT